MNMVIMVGRLVANPELKKINSEHSVVNGSIAINNTDKSADFFDFTAFDKKAESLAKWCTKGDTIAINGYLKNVKYQDRDGKYVTKRVVVINSMDFIGSRNHLEENPDSYLSEDDISPVGLNF